MSEYSLGLAVLNILTLVGVIGLIAIAWRSVFSNRARAGRNDV